MNSISEIVTAVGRVNMRTKLNISDTAISNALARNVFPPRWYRLLRDECDVLGVECSMDYFSFTPAQETSGGRSDD